MTPSRGSAAPRTPPETARLGTEIRLAVEQVSYAYSANPTQAPLFTLEATSFQARPGEIVAILGPNASGKSTLLQLIAGVLQPLSGRILLNGFVIHSLTPRNRAQRVAMVQQESRLLFPARVWQFVLQGRHAHGRSFSLAPWPSNLCSYCSMSPRCISTSPPRLASSMLFAACPRNTVTP